MAIQLNSTLVNLYDPCEHTGETVTINEGDPVMFYQGGYERHGNVAKIERRDRGIFITVDCAGEMFDQRRLSCYNGSPDHLQG